MLNDSGAEEGEDRQIFRFQFSGYAEIDRYNHYSDGSLASLLNDYHSEVIDEIARSIKTALPQPGIHAHASIEFFDGSIEWIGVVALAVSGMNLLSSISGTVDFFDKATKLIEFAVEKSVRRSLVQRGVRIQAGSFRVEVMRPLALAQPQPLVSTQSQYSEPLLFEHLTNLHKEQIRFDQLIIQNQNVILDGFVKAENEKQKLRLYIVGLVVVLFIVVSYLFFR